jgi:predicted O-methyltransferase YrrM
MVPAIPCSCQPPADITNGRAGRIGSRAGRGALGSVPDPFFFPGEEVIANLQAALGYADGYLPEDEPLLEARASAEDLGGSEPVRPTSGAVLRFLAAAIDARTVVEIGTGCGSSGIWLLRGMRPDAVLTSVDVEPEYQRMARKAFAQAGFAASRYRLILGRALDVLPRLSDGTYDMVFCDADSREYPDYLEAALRLLRVGGIVAFDDVIVPPELAGSAGAGAEAADWAGPGAAQVHELAEVMRADDRLMPLFLPVGEGMLAAVKRS